jgi:type I restriction-modification system DNA methylase subunit
VESGMTEESVARRIKDSYLRFLKSIVPETSEHDVRARFIQHFVREGLGYPEKCYINEKKWADIWLLDKEARRPPKGEKEQFRLQVLPVVVVETKSIETKNRELPTEGNIEQVFKYVAPGATKYVALTNFKRFILWRIQDSLNPQPLRNAVVDVDVDAEVTHVSFASQLNQLGVICFEELSSIYDDFSTSPNIDLGDPRNFDAFTKIVKWRILDESLIPQFQRLALVLKKKFSEYEEKNKAIENLMKIGKRNNHGNSVSSDWQKAADLERQLRLNEKAYSDSIRFENCFQQWQRMAYPPDDSTKTEERLERLARETAYTQFSRLLLVRIAESKAFLRQKLSDGGLQNALSLITHVSEAYKQILKFAFDDASHVYKRLFKEFVYDWYWEGDGELNESIKRTLWYLNQYDFSRMQQDVFKHVYQFHMDMDERRRIGEYYTPDEVVGYILDKVGYTSTRDLRGLRLLDPACGSGTFLVEAVNRLKNLGLGLSAKEIMFMTAGRPGQRRELGCIFGFDILPFPVYLSESNLLFLLLGEIQKARKEDATFVLDKFQIYRTDSLELPSQDRRLDASTLGLEFEEEEIWMAKSQKYDFIVANPPYVEVERLKDQKKSIISTLKNKFPGVLKGQSLTPGRLELFIAFLAFGISWLQEKGRLGFIVSSKFLTTKNGEWLRRLILNTCVIEEIVDLTRVSVFAQSVYPIILMIQRNADSNIRNENRIKIKIVLRDELGILERVKEEECPEFPDYDSKNDFLCYSLPQNVFEKNPDNLFDILVSEPLRPIMRKISDKTESECLGQIFHVRQGIIRGGEAVWMKRLDTLQIKEYGENFVIKDLSTVPAEEKGFLRKFVDGNSIGEFLHKWKKNSMWICYDEKWLTAPRTIENYEQEEKLLLPKRAKFLKASLDNDRIYAQDDIYTAIRNEKGTYRPDTKYVLGLLNSIVLDFYYKMTDMRPIRGNWFEYYGYMLESLPIRKADTQKQQPVIDVVHRIIETTSRILDLDLSLSSIDTIIQLSEAPTCTAGLSRLLGKREGIEARIQQVVRRKNTMSFSKDEKALLECTSEDVASFIERVFVERFQQINNKTVGYVLSETRLPKDIESMKIVTRFEGKLVKSHTKLVKALDEFKEQLNRQVAELYGLNDSEYALLKKALATISGSARTRQTIVRRALLQKRPVTREPTSKKRSIYM